MVNNDKSNRHPKGQTLPRQMKRLVTTSKCSYMFDVSWDNSGHFICLSRHSSKPYHTDHPHILDPQNISMNTKHLSEHQIESVSNVIDSTCNTFAGRNFMFTKFRKVVFSVKLLFLRRNLLSEGPTIDAADDITRMLSNFETSRDIKYAYLTDVPLSNLGLDCKISTDSTSTMLSFTTRGDNSDVVNTPVTDILIMGEI